MQEKALEVCLNCNDMERQRRSQEISITLDLIDDAAAEQLKSQAAAEGLEKGKRGTVATPQQVVGSRRRTENIFIDMSGNMPRQVRPEKLSVQNAVRRASKRKRRRGPRTLSFSD